MKSNLTISESELDRVMLCPLISLPPNNDLYECSRLTLLWAIRKSFDKNKLSIKDIRDRYVKYWNEKWFSRYPNTDVPPTGPYWYGPKQGNTISKKVFDFIDLYDVIQPEQPYNLVLNGYTIQGRYAILRKNRNKVMLLNYSEEVYSTVLPNTSSLARYIHIKNSHSFKDVSIYNFPLLSGGSCTLKYIDERLANNVLNSIVDLIKTEPKWFTPGPYCTECVTKPCKEIISDRQELYRL